MNRSSISTLTKLRQHCARPEPANPEGCWLWKGGVSNGSPAVWLVLDGKGSKVSGALAAVRLSGRDIPARGLAWVTCGNATCCNPRHAVAGSRAAWGAWVREQKLWVGSMRRAAATRANASKFSAINLEIAREIRKSTLTVRDEAARISEKVGQPVSVDVIYDVRSGRRWAEPSPFMGLGAR